MASTTTRRTSVLGEIRNAGNIGPEPLDRPDTNGMKGATVKSVEKHHEVIKLREEPLKARIVSVPSPGRRPTQSRARSSSGPLAPTPSIRSLEPSIMHRPAPVPIIEEEENVLPKQDGRVAIDEDDIDLAWAIAPRNLLGQTQPIKAETDAIEEMRREIGNLQLDMLRMGRRLKV